MTTVGYPAVGGLPAETLTTTYTTAGQAESLASGLGTYVSNATYDDRGTPDVVAFGASGSMGTRYEYDADGWVSHTETYDGATEIADHTFAYDTIGNLVERTTTLGADEWRECYDLDSRYRLDAAYTVDVADTCAAGTHGGGDRPYEHDYTYSIDGNLTERVEDATTHTYTYPAPGQARAHAPTAVGSDTYQWDPNGNLDQRTVDGDTENLTWDAEQRLSSITGPSGATSFTYDAGGARLLRETPAGRTLYIDGHEITADASGTTVTATRSYGFGGRTVATRTPTGVSYLVADQQGSVEASVTGGAIDIARTYDPYGDRRTGGELDTDQGWIGQIEDDTTDLAYLNARYYDPNIGTFISADPVYDTARPQTLNPYNYAMSNPTSVSDPSGLDPPWAWGRPDIKKPPRYFQLSYGNTNTGKAIQWAAKAHAKATGQSLETATGHVDSAWQAGYSARVKQRRDRLALSALARANPDPGFWRALAAAGSGEALTLTGMRITNPDPGFWKAVAQVGSTGLADIGKHITKLFSAANDNNSYGGGGRIQLLAGGPGDGRHYRPVGWGPLEGAVDWVEEQLQTFNCNLHWTPATNGKCGAVAPEEAPQVAVDTVVATGEAWWNPSDRYCAIIGLAGTVEGAATVSASTNFLGNRWIQTIGGPEVWGTTAFLGGGCIKNMVVDSFGR